MGTYKKFCTRLRKGAIKGQKDHGWGKSVVEILTDDLHKEFPGMSGFLV